MTQATQTLSELLAGVTMTATQTDNNNPNWQDADAWKVRLRYQGRSMTLTFYQWRGHHGQAPEAEGVMGCLLSDASSAEADFESWASDLGFDPDSRKAEKTYRQVRKQTASLRRLLGEDFESFLYPADEE